MQAKQQTFQIANDPHVFLTKLAAITSRLREHTRRDLKTIKTITGLKHIRYEDIVYLKRMIREALLNRDPNNI